MGVWGWDLLMSYDGYGHCCMPNDVGQLGCFHETGMAVLVLTCHIQLSCKML